MVISVLSSGHIL